MIYEFASIEMYFVESIDKKIIRKLANAPSKASVTIIRIELGFKSVRFL